MDRKSTRTILLCLKQIIANQRLLLQENPDPQAVAQAQSNCLQICKALDEKAEALRQQDTYTSSSPGLSCM